MLLLMESPVEINMNIAKSISTMRKRRKASQKALSELSGVITS